MAVHVVLLAAAPAAATVVGGGFLQVFLQYSFLVWPFNLVLPLARHLPRVCIALRSGAAFFAGELRLLLSGRRRVQLAPLRGYGHSSSPVARRSREELVAHTMIALVGISY
ncbi:hypothetical protein E2562_004226 [Oryza meyeriana var. granulata]|uniref:Uncharacterized protein n=1 Tax=Oryza meyeriana var. granulata TaxID=110450 RepID=A0A6G1BRM5_9ORYZ|nr:hypothetical protein E2562_004226 [Oryza meyeriana var. granulata]